jgi:hypothetical protein
VEPVKIKPKLTFCIHGSWICTSSIEIIDDENSRKMTDASKKTGITNQNKKKTETQ